MIDEDDRGSGRSPAGPTEHEATSSGGAAAEGPALRPEEEPTTTGTLFIMILFLMALGAMWGLMYFTLLGR